MRIAERIDGGAARLASRLVGVLAAATFAGCFAASPASAQPFPFVDGDGDGVADALDNC